MWLMLQQEQPDDYAIATGEKIMIKDIVNLVFKKINLPIEWDGEGINETAKIKNTQKIVVRIDPKYFRPSEVESLIGDASKAIYKLKWNCEYNFEKIIDEMIKFEINF